MCTATRTCSAPALPSRRITDKLCGDGRRGGYGVPRQYVVLRRVEPRGGGGGRRDAEGEARLRRRTALRRRRQGKVDVHRARGRTDHETPLQRRNGRTAADDAPRNILRRHLADRDGATPFLLPRGEGFPFVRVDEPRPLQALQD